MKLVHGMIGVAMLASASLAGCNPSTTSTTTAQIIAQIQTATIAACAVEPTAASIAALIAATNPAATAGVALAAQIASQICAAVAPKTGMPRLASTAVPAPITLNGVKIEFEAVEGVK